MGNVVAELTQPCCAGGAADKESEADLQPPPGCIIVTLDKSSGMKLGLDVSSVDPNCLPIKSITGGLAEQWNRNNPNKMLKPGDVIVKVNNTMGSADMLDRCKKDKVLRLVINPADGGTENGDGSARVPRADTSRDNINPAYLIEMTEMGIPEYEARSALQACGGDLRRAVEYCRPTEPESNFALPPTPPPAPPPVPAPALAPAPRGGGGGGDEKLEHLVGMGFARQDAQDALRRNNNDMDRAMAFLIAANSDGPESAASGGGGAPDSDSVSQLVAMGFSAAQAGDALRASNGDLGQAVAILSAGDAPGAVDPEQEKIRSIMEMGFSEDQARNALDGAGGNLERAVNFLMSQ